MRINSGPILSFLAVLWWSHTSLCVSLPAHEEKRSLTDVFFNERTGNVEIAHRISIHDAEHVLRDRGQQPGDLIQSEEAQSLFAKYVTKEFHLKEENGAAIKLTLVGQEIDGGYLWVYQEIPMVELPEKAFTIQNSILHDAVDQQTNTVNVRFGSEVSTFVFESGAIAALYTRPAD